MNIAATIAKLGPWLAPIAPAYFIARSMIFHLDTAVIIAITTGITVEVVGIGVSHATLKAYSWNREKRPNDPEVPIIIPLFLTLSYLAIGISLTTALELFPSAAPAAPTILFLLAAIAYITIALHVDQERRETVVAQQIRAEQETEAAEVARQQALEIERAEYERKEKALAKRRLERFERSQKQNPPAERPANVQQNDPPIVQRSPEADKQLRTLAEHANGSTFRRKDAEEWLGKAKTTASIVVKYGLATGEIDHVGNHNYQFANGKEKVT